jgi:hypothetical protein
MGLDLNLLVSYSTSSPDFANTLISCGRDGKLFDIIDETSKKYGIEIDNPITSYTGSSEYYDDVCFGDTYKTPYGDVIKGVKSKYLKDALRDYQPMSYANRAAISFIKELPDELIIYLYWH